VVSEEGADEPPAELPPEVAEDDVRSADDAAVDGLVSTLRVPPDDAVTAELAAGDELLLAADEPVAIDSEFVATDDPAALLPDCVATTVVALVSVTG